MLYGQVRLKEEDTQNQDIIAIQRIQNKLLRVINGVKLADKVSTINLLSNLGMLSINQVHAQMKMMEIWKALNVENVSHYEAS